MHWVKILSEDVHAKGTLGPWRWETEPSGMIVVYDQRTEELSAMFFGLQAKARLVFFLAAAE